jgi:putative hydrolase of the HAD superfamily
MQACLTPSADAVDLVRAVKRRHRTALLTNNVKDLAGVWQGALPAELFDVIVDSSAAGVRKPEPAAYQLTLNALHCPAERAVFIDDMDHNLGVPREMGIRVIRFDSVVQCRSELAAYGVALHN